MCDRVLAFFKFAGIVSWCNDTTGILFYPRRQTLKQPRAPTVRGEAVLRKLCETQDSVFSYFPLLLYFEYYSSRKNFPFCILLRNLLFPLSIYFFYFLYFIYNYYCVILQFSTNKVNNDISIQHSWAGIYH